MSYKTADVCDDHPEKAIVAEPIGFRDYGGRKIFSGAIHTVKCFEDHTIVEKALTQDGTGKVLIVDGGGSTRYAIMGDRLAGIGTRNNWNGVIIYGCIRDSAGIGELNMGVKALNTVPVTRVTNNEWDENIAVHFAGITFTPGHFVYCDEDGIVISATELGN